MPKLPHVETEQAFSQARENLRDAQHGRQIEMAGHVNCGYCGQLVKISNCGYYGKVLVHNTPECNCLQVAINSNFVAKEETKKY